MNRSSKLWVNRRIFIVICAERILPYYMQADTKAYVSYFEHIARRSAEIENFVIQDNIEGKRSTMRCLDRRDIASMKQDGQPRIERVEENIFILTTFPIVTISKLYSLSYYSHYILQIDRYSIIITCLISNGHQRTQATVHYSPRFAMYVSLLFSRQRICNLSSKYSNLILPEHANECIT